MKYLIDEQTLKDITNSVKDKTEETGKIKVSDLKSKIDSISGSENLDVELNAQDGLLSEQEQAIININTAIDNIQNNEKISGGNNNIRVRYHERYQDEYSEVMEHISLNVIINGNELPFCIIAWDDENEKLNYMGTANWLNSEYSVEEIYELLKIINDMELPLISTANLFNGKSDLKEVKLFDISNVKIMSGMFLDCSSLVSVPQYDTSKVENMQSVFMDCTSLVNVPVFDTSNVVEMLWMFANCPNLSDESLNNIMQMCINSQVETKTLSALDLSEEQANKCKTLSNYPAFIEAGWTTGYEEET